jgi:hypothetical protein
MPRDLHVLASLEKEKALKKIKGFRISAERGIRTSVGYEPSFFRNVTI